MHLVFSYTFSASPKADKTPKSDEYALDAANRSLADSGQVTGRFLSRPRLSEFLCHVSLQSGEHLALSWVELFSILELARSTTAHSTGHNFRNFSGHSFRNSHHSGSRGQSFQYELLYDGNPAAPGAHQMGLIDLDHLRQEYDTQKNGPILHKKGPGLPQVAPKFGPSTGA
ncbi:hypothetical protein [Synechococcus sp. PCC 7336]|uniref:hypothetical protein n=1 Tax=Synechococcus sp. PCC 7336 TaxID=195250 RepID=UPI00187D6F61|nr:hypothetical protein [Synechococcus sp. PCC 7336]